MSDYQPYHDPNQGQQPPQGQYVPPQGQYPPPQGQYVPPQQNQQPYYPPPPQQDQQPYYPPPPNYVPPKGDPNASSDDRLWALLAYLFSPLVPVILLLMEDKKNRPFIRAHNIQALAWGIIAIVLSLLLSLIPVVGCIAGPAIFVISIIFAVKAYNGEYINIPVITDFVRNQGWV